MLWMSFWRSIPRLIFWGPVGSNRVFPSLDLVPKNMALEPGSYIVDVAIKTYKSKIHKNTSKNAKKKWIPKMMRNVDVFLDPVGHVRDFNWVPNVRKLTQWMDVPGHDRFSHQFVVYPIYNSMSFSDRAPPLKAGSQGRMDTPGW